MARPDSERPLGEHFVELRRRGLIALASIVFCTLIALPLAPKLFKFLAMPMYAALPENTSFVALSPFDAWFAYFKIAMTFGLILSSPIWIFELVRFLSPAIDRKFLKVTFVLCAVSGFLFVSGALFSYFVLIPFSLKWGVAFTKDFGAILLPQIGDYISICVILILACGLCFEVPLVISFLMYVGALTTRQISRARPYAVVVIFIVAAVITPPDVVSQVAVAIPLLFLFELGVFFGKFISPKS